MCPSQNNRLTYLEGVGKAENYIYLVPVTSVSAAVSATPARKCVQADRPRSGLVLAALHRRGGSVAEPLRPVILRERVDILHEEI